MKKNRKGRLGRAVRHYQRDQPSVKLAAKIARTVKGWIAEGTRPGDVLILVRQRGPMFEAVIRALKQAQIDFAGADRLVLTEHIAIMDLLVLGDALLLRRTILRWRPR